MRVPLGEAERTVQDCRDCHLSACVGVKYGDGLVLVCEVPDHRLGQDIVTNRDSGTSEARDRGKVT